MQKGIKYIKLLATSILVFSLAQNLAADPVSYSFSSFGGGLPSSASKITKYSSDEEEFIIDDDFEIEVQEDTPEEPMPETKPITSKNTKKKTSNSEKNDKAIITATIIGAAVLTTALVAVTVVCVNDGEVFCREQAGDCCSDVSSELIDDMIEYCSNKQLPSVTELFGGSLALIPIYVP